MPDRIFVDTNILVYAHDVSAGIKNTTAKQLIQELWVNKSGCLSIQVMQEFYVTVTQKVPNPMDNATAMEVIRSLRYWNVHEPSINDIINAIDIFQCKLIYGEILKFICVHFHCSFVSCLRSPVFRLLSYQQK